MAIIRMIVDDGLQVDIDEMDGPRDWVTYWRGDRLLIEYRLIDRQGAAVDGSGWSYAVSAMGLAIPAIDTSDADQGIVRVLYSLSDVYIDGYLGARRMVESWAHIWASAGADRQWIGRHRLVVRRPVLQA